MQPSLQQQLKHLSWRDLTHLSPKHKLIELSISVPWICLSLLAAHYRIYWLAIPFSFMFFLTALRQVHNGYHHSLGLSRRWTDIVLWINSILMFTSLHAVKYNHLQHHKHCLNEHDVEGRSAKMSAIQALLYGPRFILDLHLNAYRNANPTIKRWMTIELASIFLFYGLVIALDVRILIYHAIIMILGECCTAFFTVWTVHHDCEEEMHSRTLRSKWKNRISYNMFYHLEHHLYPKVPTIHLPKLAKRIDEHIALSEIKKVW